MKILKYPMCRGVTTTPPGQVVLVSQQHGSDLPVLWIAHSLLDQMGGAQGFVFHATGEEFDEQRVGPHVGSCICGPFVWHIYRTR